VQLSALPDPPPHEQRPAVVAAVITGPRGVLAVRRRDRVRPWVFPGGKIEPAESPAENAVREVEEETNLRVRASGEIGRRTHPVTGRAIIYFAARFAHVVMGGFDEAPAPGGSGEA
jgi:8-oxo-dGTP diphosphatase